MSEPSDKTSETIVADDAVVGVSPIDREAMILRELTELAGFRAATQTRIRAEFQAATKTAQREYEDSKESLIVRHQVEVQEENQQYEQSRQRRLTRFETEYSALETHYHQIQQRASDQFDKESRRAGKHRDEARWEAETVFDATKNGPPQQLEKSLKEIEAWAQSLRSETEGAMQVLRKWHPHTFCPASEPTIAPVDNVDAFARLQVYVHKVLEHGRLLKSLRVLRMFEGPKLVGIFFFVWLALLPACWWLAGGAHGVWISWLAAAAISGGLTAWLYVRAKARILEIYPPLCTAANEGDKARQASLREAADLAERQSRALVERRDYELQRSGEIYQMRMAEITRHRDETLREPSEVYPVRMADLVTQRDRDIESADEDHTRRTAEIERHFRYEETEIESRYRRRLEQVGRRQEAQENKLVEHWRETCERLRRQIDEINADIGSLFAAWSALAASGPSARQAPPVLRLGEFRVTPAQLPGALPDDASLAAMLPAEFTLPALAAFPQQSSVLFKARGEGRQAAVLALQAIVLRILTSLPPGRVRFTIIDPVGLGENFAALMHLADYNEALITSRIWTEPRHIEQRLADLSEHMENVIQKYLRNEFASIDEYNVFAGEIAEPFRFLVVANFPANFSDAAQRRLLSIASSGARCGVYTLILWDPQLGQPTGIPIRDLEQHATTFAWRDNKFQWEHPQFGQFPLSLDGPPGPEEFTRILQAAGQAAHEASRVEVPFECIAPPVAERWHSSSRAGIDVPLGRMGATRLQSLRLGAGTSQHVLIAGKTGSGKSTLLHALITNLALRYSPNEVELYLVDFKQGVEFKTYATQRLPHARVVAVESDREFGLSVLERLDAELKLRADRFRELGVQDLASFREAQPEARMPRILLIVDEFQEFFVEDDKVSQDAALLLDRLVRQGRAFGVHVLLGSQTLAGAYSLARSTIGQMAVRIALQCSEADAHLILSEENTAARLLSRAGEAIYNDTNGLVEGNHPFQVVWLPDDRREEYLREIQGLAEANDAYAKLPQVVFEGNVSADLENNTLLAGLLRDGSATPRDGAPQAWLGESVSIKEPAAAVFRPQSGSNLLMVGQNDDAAVGMASATLVSLAAWYRHDNAPHRSDKALASFYLLDGSPAGSSHAKQLQAVADAIGDTAVLVRPRELAATVGKLAAEIDRRGESADGPWPAAYILVFGLHRWRDLRRQDDDFGFSRSGDNRPPSPAKQFLTVLHEGPPLGIHTIVWCDGLNNLNRTWDRQTLREFEMRVALQMGSADSSTLIDTPLAGKLGPHRALLHSEDQGRLEKFRPYRAPADAWLAKVKEQLATATRPSNGQAGGVAAPNATLPS